MPATFHFAQSGHEIIISGEATYDVRGQSRFPRGKTSQEHVALPTAIIFIVILAEADDAAPQYRLVTRKPVHDFQHLEAIFAPPCMFNAVEEVFHTVVCGACFVVGLSHGVTVPVLGPRPTLRGAVLLVRREAP